VFKLYLASFLLYVFSAFISSFFGGGEVLHFKPLITALLPKKNILAAICSNSSPNIKNVLYIVKLIFSSTSMAFFRKFGFEH